MSLIWLNKLSKQFFEQKKKGVWAGLTDHYVHVCARSDRDLANQFHAVHLKEISGAHVIGIIET